MSKFISICKVYADDTVSWLAYEWTFVLRNLGRWGDESPLGVHIWHGRSH